MPVPTNVVKRPQNLAFIFQETLTAVVRLRSGRQQPTDAQVFRSQMREALRFAHEEARNRGYSDDTINLAVFAVVAFLDESVLNLHDPVFANWPRKPLQEELFGIHMGGEDFFKNVRKLLAQADSAELADLLEVYQLCILAGFRGRYGISQQNELAPVLQAIREKKRRIRVESAELTDAWKLPRNETLPPQSDAWLRRLLIASAASLLIVIFLYTGFSLSLNSAIRDLRTINAESRR